MEFDRSCRERDEPSGAAALPERRSDPAPALLERCLYPPPDSPLGHRVAAAIDRSIEQLLITSPRFVVVGQSLTNRLGDGEKRVFHTPELRQRDELKWLEVLPFMAQDRGEIVAVAQRVEELTGAPCEYRAALTVLTSRMKYLLRESVLAAAAEATIRSTEYQIAERANRPLAKLLGALPGMRAKEAALAAALTESQEESSRRSTLHGGDYQVCELRSSISLMRGVFDSMWFHQQNRTAPEGRDTTTHPERTVRLNVYSIALAELGIFQKGEGGWDQRYPASPLEFWHTHLEPYLDRAAPAGSADGRHA